MTLRYALTALIALAPLAMGQNSCEEAPCEDLTPQDTDGVMSSTVVTQYDWTDFQSDAYFLGGLEHSCDQLLIDLSYSGGCAEHRLTLYASSAFAESSPVQADIWLVHDDGGDTCEAIVPNVQVYNLTPLKNAYVNAFGSEDVIIVNLRDGAGTILERFEYDLAASSQ